LKVLKNELGYLSRVKRIRAGHHRREK